MKISEHWSVADYDKPLPHRKNVRVGNASRPVASPVYRLDFPRRAADTGHHRRLAVDDDISGHVVEQDRRVRPFFMGNPVLSKTIKW